MKTRTGSIVFLASLTAAFSASPQSVSAQTVAPGSRVRISALSEALDRLEGTVRDTTGGLLLVDVQRERTESYSQFEHSVFSDTTYVVSRASLTGMEVWTGGHRNFGEYFILSVGASGLAFGALGALTWSPCKSKELFGCLLHPSSRGEAFEWGLVGGAVIGVPIGIIVGLAVKHEEWETVTLLSSKDAQIQIRPTFTNGVGLAASIPVGGR